MKKDKQKDDMNPADLKALVEAMSGMQGEKVPHHKDIQYAIFADGEHEETEFDRLVPTWGRIEQVEQILNKAPKSLANDDTKQAICERNGWEREEVDYTDINARWEILRIICKGFPEEADIKDLNLTEANKMIRHFLSSRNANF